MTDPQLVRVSISASLIVKRVNYTANRCRCGFVGRFWSYSTGAMQDPANELLRIPLLRTRMHRAWSLFRRRDWSWHSDKMSGALNLAMQLCCELGDPP